VHHIFEDTNKYDYRRSERAKRPTAKKQQVDVDTEKQKGKKTAGSSKQGKGSKK